MKAKIKVLLLLALALLTVSCVEEELPNKNPEHFELLKGDDHPARGKDGR